MDDEESIHILLGRMLEWYGFSVTFSKDGKEMLEKYQNAMQSGHKFSLVIMDLTIPGGMGGKEAIEHLIKLDKNVTAIVSSGYSNDMIMDNYKEFGFSGVLIKPYRVEHLAALLESLKW